MDAPAAARSCSSTTEEDISTTLVSLGRQWMQRMRRGQLEEAWLISDEALRVQAGVSCRHWPRHLQFIWNGTPLAGKRVLVRCYHGLGDTIQFARFLPWIGALAREVILWAQPALIPLLDTIEGERRILPLHDAEPEVDYDVDVEIMELAHALRTRLEDLPVGVPYFHVDSAPRNRSPTLQVGLVWRSGNWDPRRSIPPELLAPLQTVPRVQWHLFQRGPDLATGNPGFGVAPVIEDVVDEARQLQALDLLVSVDTCSAHLAGALAVPVWTLLHAEPDWRWMVDRDDSPWYPTMRLFRQPRPGDWRTVIANVARELEQITHVIPGP